MSSTDNAPSLALSDIMHHMSPSPTPLDEQGGQAVNIFETAPTEGSRGRDTFPEIYNEVDVSRIRRRLEELGLPVARRRNGILGSVGLSSDANASSREKELFDMVLRLTDSLLVDPAQLERQAETIANLTTQRDFIAREAEEERERWRSERESWERTAEALLSQRNKPGKSEDAERLRTTFESENRALRDKLQDAHRRLSSLEYELMRLKPMLLMQPHSISRPDKGKGREVDSRVHLSTIPEEKEANDHGKTQYYSQHQPPPKITVNSPATASTSKAGNTTHHQRRRSRDHTNSSKSQSKRQIHPLSSDAYTEHMLLAAKRIGRRRAAMVAGIMQHAEREKEALAKEQEQIRLQKEQDRLEQERQERVANGTFGAYYRTAPDGTTLSPQQGGAPGSAPPRTPKRTGIHYSNLSAGPSTNTNPIPINLESPLVYVNVNPTASQNGSPWVGSGVMGTPGQIRSALNRESGRGNQKTVSSNPPTPLASLLDAALMMDEEGMGGSKLRRKTNGKGRPLEEPDSPAPKRRKISSGSKQPPSGSTAGKQLNRVKSALDVLADQAAAAVVEPDQSDRRASVASGASVAVKGKGKAREKAKNLRHREGRGSGGEANDMPDGSNPVGQEMTSASSRGRGKSRGASTGMNTRTRTGSLTASARPVRQVSRKRANSPDRGAPSSASASTRGSGRTRGRPRGSVSKPRPGGSGSDTGTSRMISPPGPRVIAPPPGYSPLDEALAMSASVQAKGKQLEQERSEEHTQSTVVDRPMQINPKLGLRPVVGWGERDAFDGDSDSSPMRGGERPQFKDDEVYIDQDAPTENVAQGPSSMLVGTSSETGRLPRISSTVDDSGPTTQVDAINGQRESSVTVPRIVVVPDIEMTAPSDNDLDADADADLDEDEDAEGEQEDDDEDAEVEVISRNHPSRSRSPPPPGAPPPGPDNGPPPDEDDEHDADADAEGEMEFEENEDAPSGSMSSARQASKGTVASSEGPSSSNMSRLPIYQQFHGDSLPPFPANFLSSSNSVLLLEFPTDSSCKSSDPLHIPSTSHSFPKQRMLSHGWQLVERLEKSPPSTFDPLLANACANHELRWHKSKRGLRRNVSQAPMLKNLPSLVKWSKNDNQLSQAEAADDILNQKGYSSHSTAHFEIIWQLMEPTSFPKSLYHDVRQFEPPFSTVSPFIKTLVEAVS